MRINQSFIPVFPKDPQIDLTVTVWKDILKPVAAVAMGGLALAEIGHYLAVGPNVEEDVEDHHHEFEEEDRKGAKMSKIEISNDTRIIRHRTPARFSHWLLVICFFMTMFTGVAFFFPDFAWLTEILGTPQLARAIHPFTGIIMFVAFIFLGYLYWDHNIPEKTISAG